MGCNPPGSSVCGISQARILERIINSGALPNPGIKPASPALAGGFFTTEPPRKPLSILYIVSIVYMCQSQAPNSSHITHSPLGVHMFVLYACVSICFANKMIYTIFLNFKQEYILEKLGIHFMPRFVHFVHDSVRIKRTLYYTYEAVPTQGHVSQTQRRNLFYFRGEGASQSVDRVLPLLSFL